MSYNNEIQICSSYRVLLYPADISGIIKNILKIWIRIIGNGTSSTESTRNSRYDKHVILTEDLYIRFGYLAAIEPRVLASINNHG